MKIKFVIRQYIKMMMQKLVLPVIYRLSCLKKVDKKLVIFADAHHHQMPFSMKYFHDMVETEGYQTVCMISDYQKDGYFTTCKKMFQFMHLYAKAGYVVICDNFLPAASCKKRMETTVIQLWHACGAFKKFGYDAAEDIPDFYKGNVLKNCDWITVSAAFCIPFYVSAMRLPKENFYPVGISRTDLYYQEIFRKEMKSRFYNLFPEAIGKKIILWAPTFRGNPGHPESVGVDEIRNLDQTLGDEWFLIPKLHPHLEGQEKEGLRKCDMLTEELFPVADLLITDYSSVIFDFMIFNKPIVLFAADLQDYVENRGFYIEYEDLPGRKVISHKELAEAVINEYENYQPEEIKKARSKYLDACDGMATERILDLMKLKDKVQERN